MDADPIIVGEGDIDAARALVAEADQARLARVSTRALRPGRRARTVAASASADEALPEIGPRLLLGR